MFPKLHQLVPNLLVLSINHLLSTAIPFTIMPLVIDSAELPLLPDIDSFWCHPPQSWIHFDNVYFDQIRFRYDSILKEAHFLIDD